MTTIAGPVPPGRRETRPDRYTVTIRNMDGRGNDWELVLGETSLGGSLIPALARDIAAGLRDRGWKAVATVERSAREELT